MTRLLLDTSVLLWWQASDDKLTPAVRDAITAADEVLVSAASSWEASIKAALGKLEIPGPVSAALPGLGFLELPIRMVHAERAASLPPHHRDPFDRMLIAQAQVEALVLVTRDAAMRAYDVEQFWA
jgi:PIN domain nuclease of toxin-antitoxin system